MQYSFRIKSRTTHSNHAKKVTENSHTVDEDTAKLLETAETLNTSMKMFKI